MALAAKSLENGALDAEQAFQTALQGLSRDAGRLWASSLDALVVVDDERRYIRVNARAERLLGAPAHKILRSRLEHFTPREHLPRMLRSWGELHPRGRLGGDYEPIQADGSRATIELWANRGFRPRAPLTVPPRAAAGRALAPGGRRSGVIAGVGGGGPPVVLIHGMVTSSRHWQAVALQLADTPTVIAPDLIGHGDSATPRGDYSLGAHAAAIRDLLATLSIDRATIVGHSLGGGVAMQFFYQFPQRTERLVLISSGGLGRAVSPLLRTAALPRAATALPLAAHPYVPAALH